MASKSSVPRRANRGRKVPHAGSKSAPASGWNWAFGEPAGAVPPGTLSSARFASVVEITPSLFVSMGAPMSRKSSHASRGNGSPFGNVRGTVNTIAVRGSSGVHGPSSTFGP